MKFQKKQIRAQAYSAKKDSIAKTAIACAPQESGCAEANALAKMPVAQMMTAVQATVKTGNAQKRRNALMEKSLTMVNANVRPARFSVANRENALIAATAACTANAPALSAALKQTSALHSAQKWEKKKCARYLRTEDEQNCMK